MLGGRMNVETKIINAERTDVVLFNSINEFVQYISSTPENKVFTNEVLASKTGSKDFTGTVSIQEAYDLLRNGWDDVSEKLYQKLKVEENSAAYAKQSRNVVRVCGGSPVVPLYLNGIPNNMYSRQNVMLKKKVITLNKSIEYNGGVHSTEILDESLKALSIVKKLESQGYRCNINVIFGCFTYDKTIVAKIKVKSASEKLNISKLAFPLANPSMLRRLSFRFTEVYPGTVISMVGGYGKALRSGQIRNAFPGEYLLPSFIRKDIDSIKNIEDLESLEKI